MFNSLIIATDCFSNIPSYLELFICYLVNDFHSNQLLNTLLGSRNKINVFYALVKETLILNMM